MQTRLSLHKKKQTWTTSEMFRVVTPEGGSIGDFDLLFPFSTHLVPYHFNEHALCKVEIKHKNTGTEKHKEESYRKKSAQLGHPQRLGLASRSPG